MRDAEVSFPFSNLCVELKEFPAETLVGTLVGVSSRVVVELPSCPCPCPVFKAVGGKSGTGAREVLTLSSLLLLLLLLLGSGVLGGTCFRFSSSSCRSVSLFFTIILRLMIEECCAVFFQYLCSILIHYFICRECMLLFLLVFFFLSVWHFFRFFTCFSMYVMTFNCFLVLFLILYSYAPLFTCFSVIFPSFCINMSCSTYNTQQTAMVSFFNYFNHPLNIIIHHSSYNTTFPQGISPLSQPEAAHTTTTL